MVKAYLRYEDGRSIGIINSRESNVAMDPTGKLALAGCVEEVVVWNLRQAAQVTSLKPPKATDRVTRLCVKGGKKTICAVGYSDGTVRLWDYKDGTILQTLQGHKSAVSCLTFDRTGHFIASGSSDTDIVLWDVLAEAGVARFIGHVDQVTAVLICGTAGAADVAVGDTGSDASRLISASKDRFVRIWSVQMQICLQTLPENKAEVWSLALNESQTRLVSGSTDKFLRVWELLPGASSAEGEHHAKFLGQVSRTDAQGNMLTLQFARPTGFSSEVLLCQGSGRGVEVFQCQEEGEVLKRLKRRNKRMSAKRRKKGEAAAEQKDAADQEDDGVEEAEQKPAVAGPGEEAARAAATDELTSLVKHRSSAKALSMHWCAATNTVLLGLANNSMESFKLSPKDSSLALEEPMFLDLPGHRTSVRSLAVAHDDSVVMSTSAEAVKIWNVATGRCVRTMPSGYGMCCFFVAGNEHVMVGTKEGHLELYDLRVGDLTERLEVHEGAIYGMAENPTKEGFVTCSADHKLKFFNFEFTRTGGAASVTVKEELGKVAELPDECLAVGYSPNGKWVAVALLNHTMQLLFADTLKFYFSLYGHRLPVMSLDFSSDSQMVASGSADKNVKLWSTHFGNCLRSLRAHGESIMHVRFMPGTHYLVSASRDREVKLWDCDTYELITALKGHASEILAMAMAQDAAFVATASADRQIRFWKRTSEQLFLVEERQKEIDEKFENEVERDDLQIAGGSQVTSVRPSRRTVESVRTTEMLMDVLDKAQEALEELEATKKVRGPDKEHPCVRVIKHVNTLKASNIFEVLMALPFAHALRLLQLISDFFDAAAALPSGTGRESESDTKALSATTTLEVPCQAALIAAYVHHGELASSSKARALLLKLRQQMRDLLVAEKDRIGLSIAGVAQLQRVLKRSAGTLSEVPAAGKPAGGAAAQGGRKGAKRKR